MWTLAAAKDRSSPDERLAWPAMFGLGAQHVLAMFGSTAIVPVLIDFPVTTTLLFSGIGTLLFVLITRNRVPTYTGSSFAFIAPVIAANADGGPRRRWAGSSRGRRAVIVGLLIDRAGYRVVEFLLPPVVTGAIVALIGLNLAPVAKDQFSQQAGIALFTLAAILLATVGLRGLPARLSVFLGVAAGYVFAAILGKVDWTGVHDADWIGFPDFMTPTFDGHAILLIVPAVLLVLIAENAAHVKAVAAMTERDLDPVIGALARWPTAPPPRSPARSAASGTTTYAENIGVMGLTRVYSTLAYVIAGGIAIALALLAEVRRGHLGDPVGVLGGAVTVLFGLIAVLGARIWIEARSTSATR